ncbi:unnamed protein product [Tenebrio molitor]|jgi:hypothetical protein|nr:unnamed protein product [Tenebrio molitor]
MLFIKTIFSQSATRCVSTKFVRSARKDPGIAQQKKVLDLNEEEFTNLEDLESDFMEVHKTHKDHLKEMQLLKEKEKYYIVRQKYFKEKFPNFLTWHDKEQIRYLYRTDPEEWTIDRLSEGFPALPEVIKKIVKSNWSKTKQHKITNHDNSVQKNWKLFKEGQMSDLPQELIEHLNKFTNRELNFKPFVLPQSQLNIVKYQNSKIKPDFSEIISSYEKLTKGTFTKQNIQTTDTVAKPPPNETYMESSEYSKKSITFEQLQMKLSSKFESGREVSEEESRIVHAVKLDENKNENVKTDLIDLKQDKYQTTSPVQYFKKTERDYAHLNYPEKISIPKAIVKKGYIYKLNDCYYDDDGEFLYRVPGMW